MGNQQFASLINPSYVAEQLSEQLQPHKPVHFRPIKDENDIKVAQKRSIPPSTIQSTQWECNIGMPGPRAGKNVIVSIHASVPHICENLKSFDVWLSKFILEIRRKDMLKYLSNMLYTISCSLL